MECKEVFCPHCGEFVAPRTFRRHKSAYFHEENGSWDVPLHYSSDEESSTAVNYDDSENLYDETSEFAACENEEEEYMEVDLERARETIEFWEDAIEDVITDFNEDDADAGPSASLSVDAEDMEWRFAHQISLVKWICIFLLFWTAQFQISDSALELMLRFFNTLFSVCQHYAPWFGGVVMFLPTSLYFVRKMLGLDRDKYTKFVVCPNCHYLYRFSDCFITLGRRRMPKKCSHRPFPNHKLRRFRETCGELNGGYLLKEVQLKDGRTKLYPHKVYSYMSVLDTLKTFLSRKDFWFKCNLWKVGRNFDSAPDILADVFDGRVWREFLFVEGEPLLGGERSLGFMLNVDWFQPFKLARYSVGVIYLVVMNLPRNERFKVENVILVGVIPGPHEPSRSINTYLSPLVDDFLVLWEGWHVCGEIVKGVLLCVASDLPAARKVQVFYVHFLIP